MHWLDWFLALLTEHPVVSSVAAGPVGSFLITQTVKGFLPGDWTEGEYRRTVNLIAVLTGYLIVHESLTEVARAESPAFRQLLAWGAALATPTLYKLTIGLAASRWPTIDKVFSGRPRAVSK